MARKKTFAVIGASPLGLSVARELDKKKQIVKLFDISEEKLNAHIDDFESVEGIVADCTLKKVLEKNGIDQFDSVIVCISKNIEANIMVTLNIIDLNVSNFIVQGIENKHERILIALGLTEEQIIVPNKISGKLVATKVLFDIDIDVQPIDNEFVFTKVEVKEESHFDRSIAENNLVTNKDFTIVQIRREGKILIPDEYTIIKERDLLYIFARNNIVNDLVLKISGINE
ncbi:TrkA family potassium uptake protein [Spiroplasma endosymbiont of Crioceris asparagi]|uniref:potassium channel family protein n=1 Tax=Spiroplasma endosymbiont of Crioceris asparagi TaxID=3066286 RepID=UPI0030D21C53